MRSKLISGAALVACLAVFAFFGTVSAYPDLGIVKDSTLTPQVYLPYVAKNYPLPTPTPSPTSTPSPTPTPFATLAVPYRYEMQYAVQAADSRVWMPIPRYWDGNGQRHVLIREISPSPADQYREQNGTEVVYWENPSQVPQTFKVVFDVEIGLIEYGIDETRAWPAYDVSSDLYQKNTIATGWAQVNHPEIQNQALAIVGNETNPYKKARLIHQWMVQSIAYGAGPARRCFVDLTQQAQRLRTARLTYLLHFVERVAFHAERFGHYQLLRTGIQNWKLAGWNTVVSRLGGVLSS